jgi:hypothetical protein
MIALLDWSLFERRDAFFQYLLLGFSQDDIEAMDSSCPAM